MSQLLTTPSVARPVTPLGILVEKLENVRKLAENEEVSASLLTALQEVEALASGIDPYLDDCTTEESAALANLAQKTAQEDWSKRFLMGKRYVSWNRKCYPVILRDKL